MGTKRAGLAIGDSVHKMATGFDTIAYKGKKDFIERLKAIVKTEEIDKIVIGLPLNMDGSEGDAAIKSRNLSLAIQNELGIKVALTDETLTTDSAIREIHRGKGKFNKSKDKIDMMSAILILQEYFDSKSDI